MPNLFYSYKQFNFKILSLAEIHSVNINLHQFQTIQFSISIQFKCKKNLFQAIQFHTQFSSIWPIDRTLSCAATPGPSGPGRDSDERVLCIFQSSSITGASPSDCFVSYPEHSLVESFSSVEMQSVYSTGPIWLVQLVLRKIQFRPGFEVGWPNSFLMTVTNTPRGEGMNPIILPPAMGK